MALLIRRNKWEKKDQLTAEAHALLNEEEVVVITITAAPGKATQQAALRVAASSGP